MEHDLTLWSWEGDGIYICKKCGICFVPKDGIITNTKCKDKQTT